MSKKITQVLTGGKNHTISELSNEMLVDAYGDYRAKASIAEDIKDVIGDEIKRRRRKKMHGFRYTIAISRYPRETLNREKLEKLLGDKIRKYLKISKCIKILCTARQAKGKAA